MFDEVPITLIGYKISDLDSLKGWNGFISPCGLFYKVIERNTLETSHDAFVETFCDIKLNVDLKQIFNKIKESKNLRGNLSYKDMFIQILGFINYESYGELLHIGIPDKKYNNKHVTNQQIETIIKLIQINNDDMSDLKQILLHDRKHNDYELKKCFENDENRHNIYEFTRKGI